MGNSCRSRDVIDLFKEAILYQESLPQVVRTDNGTQFKANAVRKFFEKLNIIQEFGYRHNSDSQAPSREERHVVAECVGLCIQEKSML
ncbi:MAG TPA: hypothetical protein DIT26_02760 [Mesotoga infera]|uniref:Integrase catalytic domain-containing protein n=2 Tax=Mesotoga TaxID=1184396 RepID=A0A3D3TK26_9BACT|nr:hypothetical protein [Mesotoga infera]